MNLERRVEGPGRGTVVVDEPLVYEEGLLTAVVSEVLKKLFPRGSVERIVIVRECRGGQR